MPAFVTHELFGTQVFGQLDEEIQEMLEMDRTCCFSGTPFLAEACCKDTAD